jgi:ABC-type methionine transport system ATPase subunit
MEEIQEVKVELFIPGELKEEPIICNMIRSFAIELRIVEASFSTESGWAYLVIKAEKPELERAFEYLKAKGVSVEVR